MSVVRQADGNLSNDPAHSGLTIKVLEHEYDISRPVLKVRKIFCNTLYDVASQDIAIIRIADGGS